MRTMEYVMFLEYWWSLSEYKGTLDFKKYHRSALHSQTHVSMLSVFTRWQNTRVNTQKVCVFMDALSFPSSFTKICSHRLANTHREKKKNKDIPWTVLWNEYIFSYYSVSHKD